jgi:rhodanese-related sulfurtransferase
MTEVTVDQLVTARHAGAVVVDVREPAEYVTGHVPGAVLIPLAEVPARTAELPTDRPLYVICASGSRSLVASDYLGRTGLEAHSVRGGTRAWIRAGHPVVTGPGADGS